MFIHIKEKTRKHNKRTSTINDRKFWNFATENYRKF